MKQQLQKLWASKRIRYSLLAALSLAILAGGVYGAVSVFTQQYKTSLQSWHNDLSSTIVTQGEQVKKGKKPDTTLSALDALQQKLQPATLPTTPKVWDVPLASAQAAKTRDSVAEQAAKLSSLVDDIKEYINYQKAAVKPLGELSGKTTENLEQLKQYDAKWREQAAILDKAAPPEAAKNAHQTLHKTLLALNADIAALIPLYEKQDTDGFNAKKQELNKKIVTLQKAGAQFTELAKQQDIQLAEQLDQLHNTIQDFTH